MNTNPESDLVENGIEVISDFISKSQIALLKSEAEECFRYTQLLGAKYKVRLSKYVSEIPNPAANIKSVNLIEISIKIKKILEGKRLLGFKLAHIALYEEKNNPHELIWHSDLRNGGLVRAQIVISGGKTDSGAFRYIKNTHLLEAHEPNPSREFVEDNKNNIITCDFTNGSLFLINTIGYHSKYPCINKRISIMFDFLPESYLAERKNDCASDIKLSASNLSQEVIDNIDVLYTQIDKNSKSPNTPDFYNDYLFFSGSSLREIILTIFVHFKKKINKIFHR